jgi:hypothetical protein
VSGRGWTGVGLALAALLLGATGCRRHPPPSRLAPGGPVLMQARGRVWRIGADGKQPAIAGGGLGVGDTLLTEEDAGAVVRLSDGRQVELRPRARLRLERGADGNLAVAVESGAVVSRVPRAPGLSLEVLTPFGITRVRGEPGESTITVAEQAVTIAVAVGEVSFVDASGRRTGARAQETIEVSLGRVQVLRPPAAESERAPPPVEAAAAPAPEDGEQPVALAAEEGALLVRRPGEARFVARRAIAAAPGTAFKLASGDGRARLSAPGLRGRLAGRAEGSVGEATRAGAGHRLALALTQGSATVTLDGAQPHELVLGGPGAPVTVRASEPTTLTIVAGKGGPRVDVLAGAAEVEAAGARRSVVPDAQHARVVLPTARGLRVYADALEQVTLSWPASLAGARVEVATDAGFEDLLLAGRVAGAHVTLPAPRRGDLHWRVIAEGRGGEVPLVGQARFLPTQRRSLLDLAHPRNVVAEAAGQGTTVYFQSTLPALTFVFAPQAGAHRYRVRVYDKGDLGKPLVERVTDEPRCAIEPGVLKEGSYFWHALGLDQGGRERGGGRLNRLDVVYDNSLTALAIGSPRPGERVTGKVVHVSGVAPLGSKLYVNGRPAALDGKGRFELQLGRTDLVLFRLVGRDGAESYWIRTLRAS